MHMQDNRRGNMWVWVGIIVVIIAVILFIFWKPGSWSPANVPQGTPAYAPQGQLASGFPQNLILDTGAALQSSYSINYSTSTNQYTAQWDSSSTPQSLLSKYDAYLPANGWTITNQQAGPTLKSIYATDASASLNFVASVQNGVTQVVLTYNKGQ
jgi:hypothetical protein